MIVRKPLCPRLSWPACLAIAFLGLLVLPFGPQRSEAHSTNALVANDDTDGAATAAPKQESSRRDLERRLQSLEQKMDRVLDSLKEKVEKRVIKRETKEVGKPTAKSEAKELKRRVEIDLKGVDAERIKDVEKKIQDLVHQAINPERMKELEKHIHESVHQAINPERMKQLQQQIENAVNKSVNPERMEALAKQIEETVTKSLDAAGQAGKHARDSLPVQPKLSQPAQAQPKAAAATRNRQDRDLERRLERLEQKMERVIQALETSRRLRGDDE